MPTYEYKCTKCNYTFDIFQSMSSEHLKECPNCGGLVKRLIGAGAGPIFKGSGFYQTDYKNKPANSSPAKAKEEKKDTKKTTTESKSSDSTSTDKK